MKGSNFSRGLISGLILGVLFAPRKGAETRKMIKENVEGCQSRIEHMFGKGAEELTALKEALENKTQNLSDEVRGQLLNLIKDAQKKYKFVAHESNNSSDSEKATKKA